MKMITIMPDFGFGPYAWIKDASDDSCLVGGNIADAASGFENSGYKVSAAVEADFAAWTILFENHSDSPTFDWPAFHSHGIALARLLKAELGDTVRIVYYKPVEDSEYILGARTEVRMEILADGSLMPVTLRRVAPTE